MRLWRLLWRIASIITFVFFCCELTLRSTLKPFRTVIWWCFYVTYGNSHKKFEWWVRMLYIPALYSHCNKNVIEMPTAAVLKMYVGWCLHRTVTRLRAKMCPHPKCNFLDHCSSFADGLPESTSDLIFAKLNPGPLVIRDLPVRCIWFYSVCGLQAEWARFSLPSLSMLLKCMIAICHLCVVCKWIFLHWETMLAMSVIYLMYQYIFPCV